MVPDQLRQARLTRRWTQAHAARRLGVSQPYLSLLEQGRRPLPRRLAVRVLRAYDLPPTALPVVAPERPWDAQTLAAALAAVGYPGFAHLRSQRRRVNPADVLAASLRASNLEARLAEALPWVVLTYPDLNWPWLCAQAKLNDAQNRLGFVVTLARQLAERQQATETGVALRNVEQQLERSRLATEGPFGQQDVTEVERRWLQHHRSPEARHWNLLTDVRAEHLPYADR